MRYSLVLAALRGLTTAYRQSAAPAAPAAETLTAHGFARNLGWGGEQPSPAYLDDVVLRRVAN